MTTDSTIAISLVFGVIGAIVGVYGLYNANKKNIQQDDSILNEIRTSVLKSNMKLDQQCGQLTELQADIKATQHNIETMRENQIRHDIEIKAIWKQIDGLKGE